MSTDPGLGVPEVRDPVQFRISINVIYKVATVVRTFVPLLGSLVRDRLQQRVDCRCKMVILGLGVSWNETPTDTLLRRKNPSRHET